MYCVYSVYQASRKLAENKTTHGPMGIQAVISMSRRYKQHPSFLGDFYDL